MHRVFRSLTGKSIAGFVAGFLLISSSVIDAQNKTNSHQLLSQLELATILGIKGFSQSRDPMTHYSIFDTVFADTNIHSSVAPPPLHFDSTVADTSVVIVKQKSALAAVLLSAVIPGGGQIYNGSYWKLPIIYGLQGFLVYEWISSNKTYQSFKNQYEDSLKTAGPPPWSLQEQYYLSFLQTNRDGARDQRDSYAWYIAGVYALSVLDAYIDAELSGFDVSPSLGLAPDGSASAAICVKVKF